MKAIFKREFKSYFTTPLGFVILAVFYMFTGILFSFIFSYGSTNVEDLLISVSSLITFVVPIITMRLLSEERRQKVDQVLFTAPVSLTAVVLGKFFAAFLFYALCFAPTVIFQIIIISYIGFKCVAYLYALLGVLLLGAAFISIGMFVSSLTENMAVSAVVSLIANLLLFYLSSIAGLTNTSWIQKIASYISFGDIIQRFSVQLFSVPDVVMFLSVTAGFLFLSVRSLEKRRWA